MIQIIIRHKYGSSQESEDGEDQDEEERWSKAIAKLSTDSELVKPSCFLFIIGCVRMMNGHPRMNFSFMLVAPCKFLVPIFSFRVILILEYLMRSFFHYFILV